MEKNFDNDFYRKQIAEMIDRIEDKKILRYIFIIISDIMKDENIE